MDLLSQMATFVRVVETGSLSAAARGQRLSLPAVSRQLRALEDDLGATLVVRTTRRLNVTDAGRGFYEHAARILREIEQARTSVSGRHDVRGTLVVSCPISIGLGHVVPRMPALLKRHPSLTVELRLEDRVVDLVSDGVDIAVRGGIPLPDSTSLIGRPLLQFHRVAVASPAYLKKRGEPRDPAALGGHTCLVQLGAAGPVSAWRFHRDGTEQEIVVQGCLRTNTPLALREAAIAGLGIALLPDWLIGDDLTAKRLRRVLTAWQSGPVHAWAVYRAALRDAPRVRAFIDDLHTASTGEVGAS